MWCKRLVFRYERGKAIPVWAEIYIQLIEID